MGFKLNPFFLRCAYLLLPTSENTFSHQANNITSTNLRKLIITLSEDDARAQAIVGKPFNLLTICLLINTTTEAKAKGGMNLAAATITDCTGSVS
jgi:hypothetical protein